MAAQLDENAKKLLQSTSLAHMVTLMKDGSPQVTPVWVDTDGKDVLINVAEGRVKLANIARDPRVALSVTDPDNAYSYVAVRGTVVETTKVGAEAHIDRMAKKYLGLESYPYRRPGVEDRVLIRIRPDRVSGMGG